MKKILVGALSALPVVASGASVFAQEGDAGAVNPPSIVTVTDIQGTIVSAIQPWVTAGLGIGIAVFCIYLGWRLIKRFTR